MCKGHALSETVLTVRGFQSAADVDHRPRRLQKSRFANVMAGFLGLHGLDNIGAQLGVRGAGSQAAIQVVLHLGEEAGADFAVGG